MVKGTTKSSKANAKPSTAKAVAKPAVAAKPKPASKSAPKKATVAKVKNPAAKAASPKKVAKTAKPSAISKIAKESGDAISKLASDILADRITPTIEQIKAVAASALGQDQTKGSKAGTKKTKSKK